MYFRKKKSFIIISSKRLKQYKIQNKTLRNVLTHDYNENAGPPRRNLPTIT